VFDIGFWELGLIALLSLVIVGPQRLPNTIRTTLSWWRKAKQTASDVGNKLERELGLEELNSEVQQLKQPLHSPKVRPRASRSHLVSAEPQHDNQVQPSKEST